jgi:hypothetical protein
MLRAYGFVGNRAQRSSKRLDGRGRNVNVEYIGAADELALRHVLERQWLLLRYGRYVDWRRRVRKCPLVG